MPRPTRAVEQPAAASSNQIPPQGFFLPTDLGSEASRFYAHLNPLRHAKIAVHAADVLGGQTSLHRTASHFRQLARCGVVAALLLPAFWASLAVNAATPARRLRPNGPRCRVNVGLPWVEQVHESTELPAAAFSEAELSVATPEGDATAHTATPDSPPSFIRFGFSSPSEDRIFAPGGPFIRLVIVTADSPRGPPVV